MATATRNPHNQWHCWDHDPLMHIWTCRDCPAKVTEYEMVQWGYAGGVADPNDLARLLDRYVTRQYA